MMWNSFRLRISKHNIINAGNVVRTHNARNRFAGCGIFELFRRVRDDDIRFFPLAVFQELRIPHPDHFLDGEAFQLHGILADILRGLVVSDDIAVRKRPGNRPIDHDEFAFLQIHDSHDQLAGFGSQSEPVLYGGRLELFAGHAVTNHYTAEGCIHLGELLARIGVDDHRGIADTVLQAFPDIEIHILNSTVFAAAPAVSGMDSTERLNLRISVKDEVNFLIAVECDREVQVHSVPCLSLETRLPVEERTKHIALGEPGSGPTCGRTQRGGDLPGIIREHNVVAVASGVDIDVFRFGVFCTKDLPQLIEDIAGNAVADILRDRLNFSVKNLAGSTVRLTGSKLDGIIPIPEMVDKLDQNAGL